MSDVYGYATAVAKDGTASAYKIADASPKWYAKAQASGDPAKYIMNRK